MWESGSATTQGSQSETGFRPVFIVGAPRSGTTLLAVMMDRHSRLAIPPETQFFTEFTDCASGFKDATSSQVVKRALGYKRIADMGLDAKSVAGRLKCHTTSPPALLRALLESYADKQGASRAGEKTPRHNEHIDQILRAFPEAKIVCVIRDGRAVVNSMLAASWAAPNNSNRFWLFCWDWVRQIRLSLRHQKRYGRNKVLLVRYEDLVRAPWLTLTTICDFIGETIEPRMLDTSIASETVPHWEDNWKKKAQTPLDESRLTQWQRERSQKEIWAMNLIMGPALRKFGYLGTSMVGCPTKTRIKMLPLLALRLEVTRTLIRQFLRVSRMVCKAAP